MARAALAAAADVLYATTSAGALYQVTIPTTAAFAPRLTLVRAATWTFDQARLGPVRQPLRAHGPEDGEGPRGDLPRRLVRRDLERHPWRREPGTDVDVRAHDRRVGHAAGAEPPLTTGALDGALTCRRGAGGRCPRSAAG